MPSCQPRWSPQALLAGFQPRTGCTWPAFTFDQQPTFAADEKGGKPDDTMISAPDFFSRNSAPRTEIIGGLMREGQLVALGGTFGVGKSPMLADITICSLNGFRWCGRQVGPRPVIHFDFENPGPTYRRNLKNIARRYGVHLPPVPGELEIYLEHEDGQAPATKQLLDVLGSKDPGIAALKLLEEALERKPNALLIIDPVELLFRVDTRNKVHVLGLYRALKLLLARFPQAAIILTFNLRKKDRRSGNAPNLLTDPRNWLEEVCGSLDIMNRSDVRLGMDMYDEDLRVINGIRRGEEMHPMLIRPVPMGRTDDADNLAGFELVPPSAVVHCNVFTAKQQRYWSKLPQTFTFQEVVDKIIPRSTLSRLLNRAKSLGLLDCQGGVWSKVCEDAKFSPWQDVKV